MEIISKRHPFKFYLILVLCNLFFLILGSFLLIKGVEQSNNKYGFGSLFLFAAAISINIGFIKNAPSIILSKKGITFRNNFFGWNELSSAKLTGKGDMIFTSGECTTLTFKDATRIQFFDDFYSNTVEMKCFIQEVFIDKKVEDEITKNPTNSIDIDLESFISYKGNPVFSFRGIFMWGIIIAMLLLHFYYRKPLDQNLVLFFFAFSAYWLLMNSWMMHYFEISKNFFVVKNHYFFWKKHIYNISDIREVVFDRQGKQANKLRIITNDFKTKFYIAGSLTDTTWLEMKTDIESKNIIVRNECIPENK